MAYESGPIAAREEASDSGLIGGSASCVGSQASGLGHSDDAIGDVASAGTGGVLDTDEEAWRWPSGRLLTVGVVLLAVWGAVTGGLHAVSGAVWLGVLAVPLTVGAVIDLRDREIHDVTSLSAAWLLLAVAYQAAGWRHVGHVAIAVAVGSGLLSLAWLAGQCGSGDIGHGGVTAGIAMLTWADPVVARWAADDVTLRLSAVLGHAACSVAAASLMLAVFAAVERRQRRGRTQPVDPTARQRGAGPVAAMLGPAAYTLALLPDPSLLTAARWFG